MGIANCCQHGPAVDRVLEVSRLASDQNINFDARELQEFLDNWLREHPNGKASKREVTSSFATMAPAAGMVPDAHILESIVTTLDTNGDGEIDFREAMLGLSVLMRGRFETKVGMLFAALDTNRSGTVSKVELRDAFSWQLSTSYGTCSKDDTGGEGAAVDAIFNKADLNGDGELSFDEFMHLVNEVPELKSHFSIADDAFNFNHPEASAKKRRIAVQNIAEAQGLWKSSGADSNESVTAEAAVQVLQKVPGLSPVAIGEFLGRKDEDGFAAACANLFFAALELKDRHLDEAIRLMSQRLCLPREAQQIDRLIQSFAAVYCRDNPGQYPSEDDAYLTAFAIVMLNADAHSISNKKKMTKAEFIKNSSLATPAVDKNELDGIYDRITAQEIKLTPENAGHDTLEQILSQDVSEELATMLTGLRNCSAHK